MIIENEKLIKIVKTYVMMSALEYNVELGEYKLDYDEEKKNFNFYYTLILGNVPLDNSLTLSKKDMIYILNYFLKNENKNVTNYRILYSEDGLLNLSIDFENIKDKQMIKRKYYEV